MDDMVARKISVSMKNAIAANNYRDHALGKTVKQLEVEKGLKMLSLQVKKDQMRMAASSPKPRRKTEGKLVSETESTTAEFKNLEKAKTPMKPQLLPLIRSNSAASRREGLSKHRSSTAVQPGSSPPCLRASRNSSTNSSLDDVTADRRISVASNKLSRNNTASPILTAKLSKTEQGSSPPSGGVLVHRGLSLKPLSTMATQSKQQQKQTKAKAVFSRLYQVQSVKPKKSVAQLMERPTPSPRLERRRRSLSMTDLSDAMEDLRNCRYLRKNSKDESDI